MPIFERWWSAIFWQTNKHFGFWQLQFAKTFNLSMNLLKFAETPPLKRGVFSEREVFDQFAARQIRLQLAERQSR